MFMDVDIHFQMELWDLLMSWLLEKKLLSVVMVMLEKDVLKPCKEVQQEFMLQKLIQFVPFKL